MDAKSPRDRALLRAIPWLIVGATFAAFLPSLFNGFVTWDDPLTITDNRHIQGLGWENLRWMATSFFSGHYHPLTLLSLALDHAVWGLKPFGYHLTNLALHAAGAVVLYRLFVLLLELVVTHKKVPLDVPRAVCAGLAALAWSVHPLRVESVAWATERRDVLSGLFLFLSVLWYLRAQTSPRPGAYPRYISASFASLVLSLLSKAWGVTLPAVLLVLDVYPLARIGTKEAGWFSKASRRVWLEKAAFLLPAAAAALLNLLAQHAEGDVLPLERFGLGQRAASAVYGLVFYPWKTLWPSKLIPLYEFPDPFSPLEPRFLFSGAAVALAALLVYRTRRRWPALAAVSTAYALIVLPVLNLLQSGLQLTADRYAYISCAALPLLPAGAALSAWLESARQGKPSSLPRRGLAAAAVVLLALGTLTWRQCGMWRDTLTLWRTTVAKAPGHVLARYNLACELMGDERTADEAMTLFAEAARLNPRHVKAHTNLAALLRKRGRLDEAVAHYEQALRFNPTVGGIYASLADTLKDKGRIREAVENYSRALSLEKNEAYFAALAAIMAEHGNPAGTLKLYEDWAAAKPGDPEPLVNAGFLLAQGGRHAEAVAFYLKALALKPGHVVANNNLANALARLGRIPEAVERYRAALASDPDYAAARVNLAVVLGRQGRLREAEAELAAALRSDPGNAQARELLKALKGR